MSSSINDDLMSGGGLQAAIFDTDAFGNTILLGPDGVGSTSLSITDYLKPTSSASSVSDASVLKTSAQTAITYRENGIVRTVSSGFQTAAAAVTGSKAWYGEWEASAGITRIGAEFKFTAGSGGLNGVIVLIPWQGSSTATVNIPPTSLHLTVSRWTWQVSKILTENGSLTTYATGTFNTALTAGVVYQIEAIIDAANAIAYLILPDGTVATITDVALGTLGTYAGFEVFTASNTDDIPAIRRVWASSADVITNGLSSAIVGSRSVQRKVTSLCLTSVTGTTNPVPAAFDFIDSTVLPIYYGKQSNRVLITGQIWVASLPIAATYNVYGEFTDVPSGGSWTGSFGSVKAAGAETVARAGWVTFSFIYTIASPGLPVTMKLKHVATGSVILYVGADAPVSITCTPLD